MEEAVVLEHVSKNFGQNHVLKDINLRVEKGTIYGLLGHNGAGKTTTFRLIQGLYKVDSGNIKIFGKDPLHMSKKNSCDIGILGEDIGLYEGLTIKENISFFAQLYGVNKIELKNRLETYSKVFEIEEKLDETVSTLSRGMKKKVALLRTIIHQPKLLILDEPINGLDPVMAEKFCELLKYFRDNEKMTILVNSHHLEEVEKIVDNYSIIKQGKNVRIQQEEKQQIEYTIHIANKDQEELDRYKLEIGQKFQCNFELNQVRIQVRDIEELNEAIRLIMNKGVLIEGIEKVKESLKEIYLQYGH